MNVLLTGGAGYIGSHVLRSLVAKGHNCVIYDSLVKGHAEAVTGGKLEVADVSDGVSLSLSFRKNSIDVVVHLAAYIDSNESMIHPREYFQNNTLNGLTLLNSMRECGVNRLIYSSTAAVYGRPTKPLIEESDCLLPVNPYGMSKMYLEYMLRMYAERYGLGAISLRYFNAGGAHPSGDIGEDHLPETHLIPLILRTALGEQEVVTIYGDDYDTPDGTCIRDFIHVCDLAEAHVRAIDAIEAGKVKVFNLGNGQGCSVKQVMGVCQKVIGRSIPFEVSPRRRGDPPQLVASFAKAERELGWRRRYSDLKTIVSHAWSWHKRHPHGYETEERIVERVKEELVVRKKGE